MIAYKLHEEFKGYAAKRDVTKLDGSFLISPSQNVIVNDSGKVEVRPGYELDGEANAALTPIESSFDWNTNTGTELNIRSYDDELEWRYVDSNGDVTHRRIADGFTAVAFQYATVWDGTENIDILLIVDGTSTVRSWSGGVTTFASATVNTITKQGSTTWAEERFLTSGTRQVIINGTTYTYTGGESTQTLTGVTPDPTAGGHSAGDVVHQALRSHSNTPASGFSVDMIEVLNNQVYYGSLTSREVYVSADDSFTTVSFSSPRAPGEGALLTLDNAAVGFVPQEQAMYITAGKSDWYQTVFTLSSDNTAEVLTIKKLKTAPQQAAQSQNLITKIKNNVTFVSNEPTLDELGRLEQVDTPQSKPLSDPIKTEFSAYDFTGGDAKYFQNQIFVALPAEGIYLIYDIENGFWQPPQIGSFSRWAIIGNELYAHSASVPETYKMNTGTNDNGNPIRAIAQFGYDNYGNRSWQKQFDEHFTEGYIQGNTTVTKTYLYDYKGASGAPERTIDGSDTTILFTPTDSISMGQQSLGRQPLGGSLTEPDNTPKFRQTDTMQLLDFYEIAIRYDSDSEDGYFAILSHGPNVKMSKNRDRAIKK